ncbi:MAG TPA: hypothetical protein VFC10_00555 [Terriglobia bacterium]|jgi:hypothetical protein|nr:hypothetical protein [Terriglobia bacterium]
MKIWNVVTIALAAGLLVTGSAAQHEEHHQATQQPGTAAPPNEAKGMSGNAMSQMPMMMSKQNETAKLIDQLLESFAAIEAEKDPAELKKRLTAHGALLKELQTKAQAQSHMMDMMQHMMGGSMMSAEPKK